MTLHHGCCKTNHEIYDVPLLHNMCVVHATKDDVPRVNVEANRVHLIWLLPEQHTIWNPSKCIVVQSDKLRLLSPRVYSLGSIWWVSEVSWWLHPKWTHDNKIVDWMYSACRVVMSSEIYQSPLKRSGMSFTNGHFDLFNKYLKCCISFRLHFLLLFFAFCVVICCEPERH